MPLVVILVWKITIRFIVQMYMPSFPSIAGVCVCTNIYYRHCSEIVAFRCTQNGSIHYGGKGQSD